MLIFVYLVLRKVHESFATHTNIVSTLYQSERTEHLDQVGSRKEDRFL